MKKYIKLLEELNKELIEVLNDLKLYETVFKKNSYTGSHTIAKINSLIKDKYRIQLKINQIKWKYFIF